MLTIKPPISLHCQTELTALHPDMEEKIRSNYSLMNDSIRREELLYLTTSSPDMYFSEGSNTNVLNEITTQSRQEFRLEVINNLVNRIMLSNTENFSYQDSVYISNVLRKIGITDVNSFMKQVSLLQSETRQTNKLIDLYEDNRQLLMKLFEQDGKKESENKKQEDGTTVNDNRLYLHQEIFNRLSTGKIYQEVTNYANASARTEQYITHNQMSVAEQTMQSKNFRLQELKTNVFQKNAPMNFYHANTYELADEEEKTVAQQDERLTPAILLNLVDQAYSIKAESIERNSHRWYNIVNSFYETARNTIQRFDSYRREGIYNTTQLNEAIVSINEQHKNEVNALSRISNEFSDVSFAIKKYENNLGISFEEVSRQFEKVENSINRYDILEKLYQNLNSYSDESRNQEITNVDARISNNLSQTDIEENVQKADIDFLTQVNEEGNIEENISNVKKEYSENIIKTDRISNENVLKNEQGDRFYHDDRTYQENTLNQEQTNISENIQGDISNIHNEENSENSETKKFIDNRSIEEILKNEQNDRYYNDDRLYQENSLNLEQTNISEHTQSDISYLHNEENQENSETNEFFDNRSSENILTREQNDRFYDNTRSYQDNRQNIDQTNVSEYSESDINYLRNEENIDNSEYSEKTENRYTENNRSEAQTVNRYESNRSYSDNRQYVDRKEIEGRIENIVNRLVNEQSVTENDIAFLSQLNNGENLVQNILDAQQKITQHKEYIDFSNNENILNHDYLERVYENISSYQDNRIINNDNTGYQALYSENTGIQFIDNENIENSADITYFNENIEDGDKLTAEERTRILEERLSKIDEKNVEKLNILQEIEKKRPVIKDITIDKAKARENLLRALENPTDVLQEILENGGNTVTNEINRQIANEIYENFTPEAKTVYEQILNAPGEHDAKYLIQNFMKMRGENVQPSEAENVFEEEGQLSREEAWMPAQTEEGIASEYTRSGQEGENGFIPEKLQYTSEREENTEDTIQTERSISIISNETLQRKIQNSSQTYEYRPDYSRSDITYKDVVDMYISQNSEQVKDGAVRDVEMAIPAAVSTYLKNEYTKNDNVRKLVENVMVSNTVLQNVEYLSRSADIYLNQVLQPETDSMKAVDVPAEVKSAGHDIEQVTLEHVTERMEEQLEKNELYTHSDNVITKNSMREMIEKQTRQTIVNEYQGPEGLAFEYASQPDRGTFEELETKRVEEVIRNQILTERVSPQIVQRTDTHQSVSMVHKEENHEMDEELLNMLQKKTTDTVHEETLEKKDIYTDKVLETNYTQQINQVTTKQIDNIEEIVSRQVRSQMGTISDQVLNRLERRLADERRRHGY